jgi:hypothetical protein
MVPGHEFTSLDNHVPMFGEKSVALPSRVEFQVYILKHEPTAFSRNVGKRLPSDTASYPDSMETSSTHGCRNILQKLILSNFED